jgi:hypothetical protein
MIKTIIEMLSIDNFYGQSENIEIAKGKHKLTYSLKEKLRQAKRELKYNTK